MEETRPWDRQPTESGPAYAAFRIYLTLGPGRTVERAWREWQAAKGTGKPQPGSRPSGGYRKWTRAHDWTARAERFDREVMFRAADGECERAALHSATARAHLAHLAARRLGQMKPAELSVKDAIHALRALSETEGLSTAAGGGEAAADRTTKQILDGLAEWSKKKGTA